MGPQSQALDEGYTNAMILLLLIVLLIVALGGGVVFHPLLFLLAVVVILWLVSAPIEGGRWYGTRRWR